MVFASFCLCRFFGLRIRWRWKVGRKPKIGTNWPKNRELPELGRNGPKMSSFSPFLGHFLPILGHHVLFFGHLFPIFGFRQVAWLVIFSAFVRSKPAVLGQPFMACFRSVSRVCLLGEAAWWGSQVREPRCVPWNGGAAVDPPLRWLFRRLFCIG